MPEGPEVRLMTENYNMSNEILKEIKFYKYSKIKKSNIKGYNKLKYPMKIIKHFNIGKEIFIKLKEYTIIINLGFGYFSNRENKYTIIEVKTNKSNILINDRRKFSSFEIISNKDLNEYIDKLGYDPLYYNINFETFYNRYILRYKSSQELYKKLLDQRIFSGSGNYIRCELIYDSKVNPFCQYDKLSKNSWRKIYKSYNKITRRSYYSQKNNKYFEMKVYGRVDKKDVVRIVDNNRSFWYSKSIKYLKC